MTVEMKNYGIIMIVNNSSVKFVNKIQIFIALKVIYYTILISLFQSIPMNKIFEPFQYQLNLNTDSEKSPGKIKRQNSTKTISVLITPYTDVFLQAKNICLSNNLSQNLVLILAASISEQIQKQALSSQKNDSYSSISSNLSQQSKKKSFKNRFCQSLQESKCSNADNQSTFINNDLTTNKSILNNSDQEQYSFRPVTYLKMLDMTDDDQENQSISINDFSVNQSYLTNDSKKSKQIGKIVMKNIFSKKSTNVFDNLYQHSKILSCKKEIQLKKSIQKNIFKPQINQMSKKILQNKQQAILQTKNNFTLKSTEKFKSRNQSPQFFTRSKSKSNLYANITEKNNSFRLQSQKQNQLSIYERGMIYRKKSQQKLFKMKERQIIDQIKSCTFKPKLNQRDKSQKSKLLSVSYRKII